MFGGCKNCSRLISAIRQEHCYYLLTVYKMICRILKCYLLLMVVSASEVHVRVIPIHFFVPMYCPYRDMDGISACCQDTAGLRVAVLVAWPID